MPIYEYVCEKCGAHLEVLQKVSDVPLKRCQKCRGKLEKIVSRTSFQLKGSGWYVSDYSSKSGQKKAEKTEKAEKTDKVSKTESSTSGASATSTSD